MALSEAEAASAEAVLAVVSEEASAEAVVPQEAGKLLLTPKDRDRYAFKIKLIAQLIF